MIHVDRELHKLAIALECESQNQSLALVCSGASAFHIILMRTEPWDTIRVIGSGSTATEAFVTARARSQTLLDDLARTYADRHGIPVGLPSLVRHRKAK